MTPAETVSIVLSTLAITITILRWAVSLKHDRARQRLEFLRELSNSFFSHNWNFIDHWDFPGVYPPLKELKGQAKTEEDKQAMGLRVVTFDHLTILQQVFTYSKLLTRNDIQGFACWARCWYDGSRSALEGIFTTGDVYSLDFIIWLRDVIFVDKPFAGLMGDTLKERLHEFESGRR